MHLNWSSGGEWFWMWRCREWHSDTITTRISTERVCESSAWPLVSNQMLSLWRCWCPSCGHWVISRCFRRLNSYTNTQYCQTLLISLQSNWAKIVTINSVELIRSSPITCQSKHVRVNKTNILSLLWNSKYHFRYCINYKMVRFYFPKCY